MFVGTKSPFSVCFVVCLQSIAWILCALVGVCVCAVSVCVPQAGEVRAVRWHFLPVKSNVQVMERTKPRQGGVCVSRAGVATTAPWVSYNRCTHTHVYKSFLHLILCISSHESAFSSFGYWCLTQKFLILVWFSYYWAPNLVPLLSDRVKQGTMCRSMDRLLIVMWYIL